MENTYDDNDRCEDAAVLIGSSATSGQNSPTTSSIAAERPSTTSRVGAIPVTYSDRNSHSHRMLGDRKATHPSIHENPQQTYIDEESHLTVANRVPVLHLPIAEEVAVHHANTVCLVLKWLACGFVTFVIIPLVVFFAVRVSQAEEGEIGVVQAPNYVDGALSTEEYILGLLPEYTRSSIDVGNIQESPPSPQTQAYFWVFNDPYLADYQDWRIVQRFALATLYYATGGDTQWVKNTDWLSYDVAEYNWYYATLFEANTIFHDIPTRFSDKLVNSFMMNEQGEGLGHVWLYANGLRGTLPPEFFLLTSLRTLDLASNRLQGQLPTQIGDLRDLEMMALFNNELSGSIPSEVGTMESMLMFELFANQLTGTLPTELGLLDCWVMQMDNNDLVGSIPSEIALQSNLLGLHLHANQLGYSIPTEFGRMTSLFQLSLQHNRLTGTVPDLGQMDTRQDYSLYIDYANRWFFGLGDLVGNDFLDWFAKGLALHTNRLTGSIPSTLMKFTSSHFFSLHENLLTGRIPSEFGKMRGLQALLLFDNALEATIPTELGRLDELKVLALSQNHLTGSIPIELARMAALNALWLQDNHLSGFIPAFGDQFASDEPFPSKFLPPGLWGREALLAELDLSGNRLSGSIPANLIGAKLVKLSLASNRLIGTIPSLSGGNNNDYLQEIHLSDNSLYGNLPTKIGSWSSGLTKFNVSSNHFSGTIPSVVEMMRSLKVFDISNNAFQGTIPRRLCNLGTRLLFGCSELLCGCQCRCPSD